MHKAVQDSSTDGFTLSWRYQNPCAIDEFGGFAANTVHAWNWMEATVDVPEVDRGAGTIASSRVVSQIFSAHFGGWWSKPGLHDERVSQRKS